MAEYFRLRDIIREIYLIYGTINDRGKDLDLMLKLRKRGGGYLRENLSGPTSFQSINNDPRAIPSAATFWGPDITNENRDIVSLNFDLWGWSKLPTNFRSFLFKMVNGRLYLNNVLIHMNIGNGKCTFCTIKAKADLTLRNIDENRPEYEYYLNLQPAESVAHLFWDCEHVQQLIQKFYRYIRNFDWLNGIETIGKKSFFLGIMSAYPNVSKMDIVWKHFTKFFIFECRNRRKLPTFPALKFEFEGIMNRECMRKEGRTLAQLGFIYEE